MQELVVFRDYQEQTASDHNGLQANARRSFDTLVKDAVSNERRFGEFQVSKSGQAEVTIAPGRFYDIDGGVYAFNAALTQSVTTYLAAASRKLIAVSAFGIDAASDTQERDFLINVATGQTEPQAVSMASARQAQIVLTPGAESPDPQPPAVSALHVIIAYILVDTTQVVSVMMQEDNRVQSTAGLGNRMKVQEAFKDAINPRVAALASDLADLANRASTTSSRSQLAQIQIDLARVKQTLRFPANAAGYGSDFFLDASLSDTVDTAALGYDAKIEEGIRFPDANKGQFELSLFSANDPNARLVNGYLLPAFSSEIKIQTGDFYSELGMAQYGYQTISQKIGYMSRSRIRYGGGREVCSNGNYWNVTPGDSSTDLENLYDVTSTEYSVVSDIQYDPNNWAHEYYRTDTYWLDSWKEPFQYAVTQDSTITGALIAQTVLISNDIWATRLAFYVTAKGANEDIHLTLCQVTNGYPDVSKGLMTIAYPAANIVNGWNTIDINPTFLQKGARIGLVLVSNANHKLGLTSGQSYLDGTFFYSTDGQYFLGDLTKDLMLQIWGAKFNAAQVAIEFAAINLDGGLRDIDILAEQWVPSSTQLIFEVRPNGAGDWQPLTPDNSGVLAGAPPLTQFRARFVGTRDMMPSIHLTGSRVAVSRPKTAFKHVSSAITVPSTTAVTVVELLEGFDETPHDVTCQLRNGALTVNPTTTVTKLLDADAKRYQRTFSWTLGAATTGFRIITAGTTTSPSNTFHVAERDYYTG